jgi:hypothetical protein
LAHAIADKGQLEQMHRSAWMAVIPIATLAPLAPEPKEFDDV